MKRRNKFFALLCALVMLISTLSMTTFAEETASAPADEVSTMAYKLPAVTGYVGASRLDGVYLTWNRVSGAAGYLIYGIRGNGGTYGYIGMTSSNVYIDTKASTTQYSYYWVFPYNYQNGKMVAGYCSSTYKYGKKYVWSSTPVVEANDWNFDVTKLYYDNATKEVVVQGQWFNTTGRNVTIQVTELTLYADYYGGRKIVQGPISPSYITIYAGAGGVRTYRFKGSQIKSLSAIASGKLSSNIRYYNR